MKWIIQDNLFAEKAVSSLIEYLNKIDEDVEMVKVIPFTDGQLSPDPDIPDGANAIVIGSHTLSKYAKRKYLYPGSWLSNDLNYKSYIENYGDRMLNADAVFVTLEEARHYMEPDKEYFIRPNDDGKSFAGEVITGEECIEWFKKVMMYEGTELMRSSIVMVCPLKKIYDETRFIVLNDKVITGSQYKVGSRVVYSDQVDQEVYDYAQECIDYWSPDVNGVVIDIARTPEGMKVIEFNNMNSAGWYHCDVQKVVNTILEM